MPMFLDTTPPGQCVFCKLIAGDIPSSRVFEDQETLAFLDLGQVNPGHTLVTVKRHADNLLDLTADEAAAAMRTAHRVAHAIRKAFNPPGLTLLQCNGKEGEQTVFHFHLHLVPRWENDGVGLSWPRKDPARDLLEQYAAQLREAIAAS